MGILPAGNHHFSKAMGNHSETVDPAEKLPKSHPCWGEPNTITSASARSSPDQTHPVKLCLCRNQSTAQVMQWGFFVCFMNKGSQKISLDYKSPGHALEKKLFSARNWKTFPLFNCSPVSIQSPAAPAARTEVGERSLCPAAPLEAGLSGAAFRGTHKVLARARFSHPLKQKCVF